jgi:hypothetical protein
LFKPKTLFIAKALAKAEAPLTPNPQPTGTSASIRISPLNPSVTATDSTVGKSISLPFKKILRFLPAEADTKTPLSNVIPTPNDPEFRGSPITGAKKHVILAGAKTRLAIVVVEAFAVNFFAPGISSNDFGYINITKCLVNLFKLPADCLLWAELGSLETT